MLKTALLFLALAACSETPAPPTKAAPMLQGACVDRVVPNLFGPGVVSYQECRWWQRVWVCRLEIDSYRAVQAWRCVAVAEEPTRTAPAAPAAPSPADLTL